MVASPAAAASVGLSPPAAKKGIAADRRGASSSRRGASSTGPSRWRGRGRCRRRGWLRRDVADGRRLALVRRRGPGRPVGGQSGVAGHPASVAVEREGHPPAVVGGQGAAAGDHRQAHLGLALEVGVDRGHRVGEEVTEEKPAEQIDDGAAEQGDERDRHQADQEVGEGQPPPHLPQRSAVEAPGAPQQAEDGQRRQDAPGQRADHRPAGERQRHQQGQGGGDDEGTLFHPGREWRRWRGTAPRPLSYGGAEAEFRWHTMAAATPPRRDHSSGGG